MIEDLRSGQQEPSFESFFDLSAFEHRWKDEEEDVGPEEEEDGGETGEEERKSWEALSRGSLVCVRLTRRWPWLNLVTLQFAPWLVLANETSEPVLLQQGEAVCAVPPGDVLVPPDCKVSDLSSFWKEIKNTICCSFHLNFSASAEKGILA